MTGVCLKRGYADILQTCDFSMGKTKNQPQDVVVPTCFRQSHMAQTPTVFSVVSCCEKFMWQLYQQVSSKWHRFEVVFLLTIINYIYLDNLGCASHLGSVVYPYMPPTIPYILRITKGYSVYKCGFFTHLRTGARTPKYRKSPAN